MKYCPLVILLLLAAIIHAPARAAVQFKHVFAPQDGMVAPAEKPYRSGLCLNGLWQFEPVDVPSSFHQNVGPAPILPPATADGWDKTPIRIPSPWNVNGFPDSKGLGGDFRCFPSYPASWDKVQMGWLHRTFFVPKDWQGRRLILHFDAVAGNTQVLVNNKPVGQHFDNFLPFDLDITDSVQFGASNDLLVGVRKGSLFDVQGKYGRRTYQGGSMWGEYSAGIWQDVTLEAVPTVHITDVFVKPQVDQSTLEADVTIQNDTDHSVSVDAASAVYPWISKAGKDVISAPEPDWTLGKTMALHMDSAPTSIPAHSAATVTIQSKVNGKLDYWTPDSPNLYGMICRIKSGSSDVIDSKYTRFGWRQITFQGKNVLLNGKRIIMKGDAWHFMGIPEMTRRYAWAWFKAMHDAHLNAVRLHAEPYPSFFLDVADEQGVLVLDETAMWGSDGGPKFDDPAFWTDANRHLTDLILRDRTHPSIFGWSVSNELLPVLKNVFHAPQPMVDDLFKHDAEWLTICRTLDPTRPWVSTDGEDDAGGTMPDDVNHYGGPDSFKRAAALGKPWGVGEAGPAYYGTPAQIADMSGDQNAYLSQEDRMEGVAAVSYQDLIDQRTYDASYRSVFNMVWYGLKPLNLGMPDTKNPPTLQDGIFFPTYVPGQPGVQPERIGPYCTTLNPGYDPSLPLYQPWPLFDAIRDAQGPTVVAFKPEHSFTVTVTPAKNPADGTIKSVRVLSGTGGKLAQELTDMGVPVSASAASDSPLFIDGAQPPAADAKTAIQNTLNAGGTVWVWGADPSTIDQLNALLPYPLAVTSRTAASLVTVGSNPLTDGLTPASLYFCELNPSTILSAGLGGALIDKSMPLLTACNTDWMLWNRQPEATKTAMVLRSERESKPSGVALAELAVGKGELIVCNLPTAPQTAQATALNRTLLGNLGIALGGGIAQSNIIGPDGTIDRVLANGRFPAASVDAALSSHDVDPNSGSKIVTGAVLNNHTWRSITADSSGILNIHPLNGVNSKENGVVYLSFWLFSPKDLSNLLLDPNLPNLELTVGATNTAQIWLNGKSVKTQTAGSGVVAPVLPLGQGWNSVIVKVVLPAGEQDNAPSLRLQSNQTDYIGQLRGVQEQQ